MKILGREPALIVGVIGAFLTTVAATGVDFLSAGQAAAATAAITAIVIAVTTRPVGPALFTGAWTAIVALLAEYQLDLSDELVGAVSGLILAVFAFITREQVSPQNTMISHM